MHVALQIDTPNLEPLEPILDALEGLPIRAWIASSAFISLGPSVVHHLRLAGFDAFLDLRLCGEADTVGRAVEAVRRQGALGVTVDLASGVAAARAAQAATRGRLQVIGVTGPMDAPHAVEERLLMAAQAGLRAVYVDAAHAADASISRHLSAFSQVFLRGDHPTAQTTTLVVGDRILAAADPRAACDALFVELQRFAGVQA